jgi:hypothetical protein
MSTPTKQLSQDEVQALGTLAKAVAEHRASPLQIDIVVSKMVQDYQIALRAFYEQRLEVEHVWAKRAERDRDQAKTKA